MLECPCLSYENLKKNLEIDNALFKCASFETLDSIAAGWNHFFISIAYEYVNHNGYVGRDDFAGQKLERQTMNAVKHKVSFILSENRTVPECFCSWLVYISSISLPVGKAFVTEIRPFWEGVLINRFWFSWQPRMERTGVLLYRLTQLRGYSPFRNQPYLKKGPF